MRQLNINFCLLIVLIASTTHVQAQGSISAAPTGLGSIPTGVVTSAPVTVSTGIPTGVPSSVTTGIPTSVPTTSSLTILSVLQANNFDDTVQAISAAGLTSLFDNPSATLTFFAANDSVWSTSTASQALSALPTSGPTSSSSSSSSSAVSFLTRVILGATFNQSISLSSLSPGSHNFTSLIGLNLTIVKNSSGSFVGPFSVVKSDVAVGSSFIDVLDGVLVPPPPSTTAPVAVTSAPSAVTSAPISTSFPSSVPISTGVPSGVIVGTSAPTSVAGVPNGASIILPQPA
ncbi:hypothetical protein Gasu2_11910 [Galdieria sulphuraria]|uniref:FAS1 domain-containing protein n=1 Tax=Galdieria sulphuraria TaxID=130081 RepID=M2X0F2_GALSU|nr:uncharacterized protein Gasu_28120 [Galdieria sulphuraria]EME29810.1 hypothetical protein Gasu_28120 [Galdieria sulphuraria]GJD06799.1 hypothetical protein Gasu2_11910 [Galdieria sulphuraria]|eukprot:XP_005706330.1 hypothetical protein Gasu_28120 [Galdieria sulphuraria]